MCDHDTIPAPFQGGREEVSVNAQDPRPVWPPDDEDEDAPSLHHTISRNASSVMAVAYDPKTGLAFTAATDDCIAAWDTRTFQQRALLQGHTGGVLALELAHEKGDNTVRIWCADSLVPLFVVYPAVDNVGDIFALTWCPELETLYLGCQDTSLQWICLSSLGPSREGSNGTFTPTSSSAPSVLPAPILKPHRFFDSIPTARKRKPMSIKTTPSGSGTETPPQNAEPAHSDARDTITAQMAAASFFQEGASASVPEVRTLQLSLSCIVPSAHMGYVYALTILHMSEGIVLASASGDGSVKLWHCTSEGVSPCTTLVHTEDADDEGGDNAVLALASWDRVEDGRGGRSQSHTLFAGLQGGTVDVWDLETLSLIRSLSAHAGDVLALVSHGDGTLYTTSENGRVRRWDHSFRCNLSWKAHSGIVLSAVMLGVEPDANLITGASDNLIKVWDVHPPRESSPELEEVDDSPDLGDRRDSRAAPISISSSPLERSSNAVLPTPYSTISSLLPALARFVKFRSVSVPTPSATSSENLDGREECRQAAHWLKAHLAGLGAETKMLPGAPGRNPLVLATFKGKGRGSSERDTSRSRELSSRPLTSSPLAAPAGSTAQKRQRCLFYGHYDVISPGASGWTSSPWTMSGRDGYLYGRGVSDNKGPTLAVAYAASQLLAERKLDADVVMLIEGEEEVGSAGFCAAVRKARKEIGEIDVILVSNSYWLGEETPCITIGLRGVVRATLRVSSTEGDVHSGVEGGAMREPMIDMVKLLSNFTDGVAVRIPHFYDDVRAVTPEERETYDAIVKMRPERSETAEALMARWRHPSFSVHRVAVSGPGNSTVIPSEVEASISIRIVPDQDLDKITDALVADVHAAFRHLDSPNKVTVRIDHRADWWLGSPETPYSEALATAVEYEWGKKAVNIREGGSIPALAILEKELEAPAVHLPLGQSSDRAHLPDERIRLLNLEKGSSVVGRFLESLGRLS